MCRAHDKRLSCGSAFGYTQAYTPDYTHVLTTGSVIWMVTWLIGLTESMILSLFQPPPLPLPLPLPVMKMIQCKTHAL